MGFVKEFKEFAVKVEISVILTTHFQFKVSM